MLAACFPALSLAEHSRIFVPLCGKSRDIAWLMSEGHRVVAVELSELAIQQLFQEMAVDPTTATSNSLKRYSAPNLDVFAGDVFELDRNAIGDVDAVYDRAALVALAAEARCAYAAHIHEITQAAPQLVICLEYDQNKMDGPPFSVDEHEMIDLYGQRYDVSLLSRSLLEGGLKGVTPVQQTAWLLRARNAAPSASAPDA